MVDTCAWCMVFEPLLIVDTIGHGTLHGTASSSAWLAEVAPCRLPQASPSHGSICNTWRVSFCPRTATAWECGSGKQGSLQLPRPLFRVIPAASASAAGSLLVNVMSGVLGYPRHLLCPLPAACMDPAPRPLAVTQRSCLFLLATSQLLPCSIPAS